MIDLSEGGGAPKQNAARPYNHPDSPKDSTLQTWPPASEICLSHRCQPSGEKLVCSDCGETWEKPSELKLPPDVAYVLITSKTAGKSAPIKSLLRPRFLVGCRPFFKPLDFRPPGYVCAKILIKETKPKETT